MTRRVADFREFMSDHVNLNPTRYERLKRSDKAVSDYLAQHLDGYEATERQGSYALRTTIRPVKDNDEFDVDRLVFMEFDRAKSPKDYIDDVYKCLKDNGNYADKVGRKTRCVTVNYADDFNIDLVPCITLNGSQFICNRKTNGREQTDGNGYRDWFNRKNEITNGNLKLVTRLLKYLRDHKKTFTAPSILLTTLIGHTVYDWEDDTEFKTIPDALLRVITRLDDFLQARPMMPDIPNPALPSETFTRHWDQDRYERFRDMISSYAKKIQEAYSEEDEQASVRKWRELFGDGFGSLTSTTSQSAAKMTPRIVRPSRPYAAVDTRPARGRLSLSQSELEWLRSEFPGLRLDSEARVIEGELELRAAFDSEAGNLRIGADDATASMESFLIDSFSIKIELDSLDQNGWPRVFEVGARQERIAERERINSTELHFYPDGSCCLGLQPLADRRTTLQEFVDEMVVPFFYRLSYTGHHGIQAARQLLWDEYAHGEEGLQQYVSALSEMASQGLGRNDPCACGSGRKYKRCHLGEVERFKQGPRSRHRA